MIESTGPHRPASPEHVQEPQPLDRPEREWVLEPRIYAASLLDYNHGRLHGAWVDAAADPDDIQAAVGRMLSTSPTAREGEGLAEEWAIHDYEGFSSHIRMSEYESVDRLSALGQFIAAHGDAGAAWIDHAKPDLLDGEDHWAAFSDAYVGAFESRSEFADQLVSDFGYDLDRIDGVPDSIMPYVRFDADSWARDLEIEGAIFTASAPDGQLHVFWSDR